MATIEEQFKDAEQRSKTLPKRPNNDQLLQLYALYKQSTVGDATGARPGFSDFQGRAKFDAWAKIKGKSKEAAMKEYVDLVQKLEKELA